MQNPFKDLSKPQLYAVMAGGGAIGIYALYKHHQTTGSWSPFASSSASSTAAAGTSGVTTTSGTVTDPTTGTVYSDTAVDPNTGMSYAAEITQYGSVAQADTEYAQTYGGTESSTGVTTQAYDTGYTYQQGSSDYTTTSGQNVYVSNSAWAQAVQAGLADISGSTSYDGTDIGTAIGAYLQGQPLTTAQASLISTAIAEFGKPPQGAPPITTVPTSTPGSTMVSVPNVVGQTMGQAHNTLTSAGLAPVDPAASASGESSKKCASQSPNAGTSVTTGTKVTITAAATATETVTVPNVVGDPAGEAHNVLTAAGLTPSAPKGQLPNYKVSKTSPAAGAKVAKGSKVTISTSGVYVNHNLPGIKNA